MRETTLNLHVEVRADVARNAYAHEHAMPLTPASAHELASLSRMLILRDLTFAF